jgi:hypothetical protein
MVFLYAVVVALSALNAVFHTCALLPAYASHALGSSPLWLTCDDSIRFLWRGRRPVSMNGVSIIKPLLDKQPDLRANLQSFFNLAERSPTLVRGAVIFLGFCAFRSAFLPLSFTFSLRAD